MKFEKGNHIIRNDGNSKGIVDDIILSPKYYRIVFEDETLISIYLTIQIDMTYELDKQYYRNEYIRNLLNEI